MRLKRFWTGLLAVLCTVLFLFSSCQKEPEEPAIEPPEMRLVEEKTEFHYRLVPYALGGEWRPDLERNAAYAPVDPSKRLVSVDDPNYDAENDVYVKETLITSYTFTEVSKAVKDYLDEDGGVERQFLIRPIGYNKLYGNDYILRDTFFETWRSVYLSNESGFGEVVPKLGFIKWWGTDRELLAIAGEDNRIMACFYDEFSSIYGMSIEQAQALVDAGELDIWGVPVETSALYAKTAEEIAAYLSQS